MKPLLLLLIPLFLHANILSPDAQAILRGTPMAGAKSLLRSGGTLSGMIMVNSSFDDGAFAQIGGEIVTRAGNVCTVNIPYDAVGKLTAVSGIEYFSPARKVQSRLDKALPAGGLILAHEGLAGGNAYSGEGVVVGIVDGGFDLSHPAFYDMTKGETRISRVWDQKAVSEGTPPAGYSYGREYKTKSEILDRALTAEFSSSHGTHVAGIAAGSRVDLGSVTSLGVAPEAELVFVATSFYDNGIVDGIRYVFDYAESVGKPAVVNLSLGSHYGPHDGSSAVDRVIEAFTGPGRIVVGSAGNERTYQVHLAKDASQSSVKSFFAVPYLEDYDKYMQQITVWGERDKNVAVGFSLYNSYGSLVSSSSSFSISEIISQGGITGTLNTQGDGECRYWVFATKKSPLNNRPELLIQLESPSKNVGTDFHVALELRGEGEIHSWTCLPDRDSIPDFYSNNLSGFVDGDTLFTVGEVGGTGRETITVASYNSRTSYTNLWNKPKKSFGLTEGDIAPYSSMGPTMDRRQKPDIAAPGDVLISALRSDYIDSTEKFDNIAYENSLNGVTHYYGGMSGTSMSAPFVTGTVALMLEANPALTPAQIKEILKQSAQHDDYTGAGSSGGSYSWGWGKVDVDAALKLVESRTTSTEKARAAAPTLRSMRSGSMELQMETPVVKTVDIRVMDLRGRELVRRSVELQQGMNLLPVDVKSLAPGAYLYRINGAGVNSLGKVVHLR